MKTRIVAFLIAGLAVGLVRAEEARSLTQRKDRISYALGVNMGSYWKRQGLVPADVDWDLVIKAFQDTIAGSPPLLNDQESREALKMLTADIRLRYEARQQQLGEKNQKEGAAFLARNQTKPGVQTLPSGLQYKVIAAGTGSSPTTNSTVAVRYRGTLIDGTEFDSTYGRNQPVTLRVMDMVKGWAEALPLMKAGAKWQLVLPPELAYSERGFGPVIAPNATLLYEVELVSINPPEKTGTSGTQPAISDIIKVPSAEELQKGAKIEIIKPNQAQKEKEK